MPSLPSSRTQVEDSNKTPQTRRVLLLEDDLAFQAAIQAFLELHFYEVVAVPNGADGVRAILKEDFDVIICDMMMPKLPGDMFYTAVERMRPHLCRRFIFITGHRGNPKVDDFIKKVKGTMLPKPFQMHDLMETIGFVNVQSARL